MIKSKALEVNLSSYRVDVTIDEKYLCLRDVLSDFYGLMDGLNSFLKELSHPYKNYEYIITEARAYSLNYFHLLKEHPKGVDVAMMMSDIYLDVMNAETTVANKIEAVDNLLLFMQKMMNESGEKIQLFFPVLFYCCKRIEDSPSTLFMFFVKSYYQINRLISKFIGSANASKIGDYCYINALLSRYYHATYNYWLDEKDPLIWFEKEITDEKDGLKEKNIFDAITHSTILVHQQKLEELKFSFPLSGIDFTRQILSFPGYSDIVEIYRRIPQRLLASTPDAAQGNRWKVIFLFHTMNTEGLSLIQEDTLRDINRTLSWLIENESHWYIQALIEKTFSILEKRVPLYPGTVLNCIVNIGKGIYKTGDSGLVNFFIGYVAALGFQTPQLEGVGDDWQVIANSAHILNIRCWMELIELKPKWTTRLLSNLVIHLAVSGVYIKDTDLFPRDITKLLNSDIAPVYNLVKQLTRLFPCYFNDIGAEGRLRDISTHVDELTHRKDILIHFLRKQSHVESSNRTLELIKATIKFWSTKDKTYLEEYVPPAIFEEIRTDGPYIDGVHHIFSFFKKNGISAPDDFLPLKEPEIRRMMSRIENVSELDSERSEYLIAFYKLLYQKYNVGFLEMNHYLDQLNSAAFPKIDYLKKALKSANLNKRLFMLLDYLELLKSIILSPKRYDVREDIYKKRHFTVDIPSMYGSYHELKFDALSLTFRIESLVNVLFEEIIENIDLNLITKATFSQIYDRLMLFNKALKIDGIASAELERQLELLAHSLEVRGFTYTQYLDIFKGFAHSVKNIIVDHFNNIHGKNLTVIGKKIAPSVILEKYFCQRPDGESEGMTHRISEIFFRDRISTALGLKQLDLFLSRILKTLFNQSSKLPKDELHLLLNYDPKKAMTSMNIPNAKVRSIIYLGNKGMNLIRLKNFGLPVPAGFIITTEAFRCRRIVDNFPPAQQNFRWQIAKHILELERIVGKKFGDEKNPLIVSVRSGASISQPGMMDTFLNVGLNEAITNGLAKKSGNAWFSWDCYRRFLQCWGMACGLFRDDFDAIISDYKTRLGIPFKKSFSGDQMKSVALSYKRLISDCGHFVPEEPLDQLHLTIKFVLDSWESTKARTYREIMGISDDWGTAVTVQNMIFGNLSEKSGSGVIFTHNPRWFEEPLNLWGDFTLGNQGEDVVSGLVKTLPISVRQQEIEMRNTDITLETHFPEIYKTMKRWAKSLVYDKGWSPQEMEFTFEKPFVRDLYLLQTRDMAIRERKKVLTFDPAEKKRCKTLGNGIGVSGGAMSGRLVFSLSEIGYWRTKEPKTNLILMRNDTVPDDIREINAADGVLTARGGVTSHAAVVAHRLGKTCVVGCSNLVCDEKKKISMFVNHHMKSGDFISIDGRDGEVFEGKIEINES